MHLNMQSSLFPCYSLLRACNNTIFLPLARETKLQKAAGENIHYVFRHQTIIKRVDCFAL
jgi:hypothetical protein